MDGLLLSFSAVESSYFCTIVNVAHARLLRACRRQQFVYPTYTSVNVIFVYVPTIYFPYKAVTKFRFQCSIFYFGHVLSRVLWVRLSHDSN